MTDNNQLPKADRRGTSVLVPIGIGAVFVLIAILMLMRDSPQPAIPDADPGAVTQPSNPDKQGQ